MQNEDVIHVENNEYDNIFYIVKDRTKDIFNDIKTLIMFLVSI